MDSGDFIIIFLCFIILFQSAWIRILSSQKQGLNRKLEIKNNHIRSSNFGGIKARILSDNEDNDYISDDDSYRDRYYFDPSSADTFDSDRTIIFDYTDANDKKFSRTVDVKTVDKSDKDNTYIQGFCHLRNAMRTFTSSRMENCANVETGEIISDPGAYLYHEYKQSPGYSLKRLESDFIDVLKVLLFLGKADDRLVQAEREFIRKVCKDLAKDKRIDDEAIDKIINNIEIPSIQAFKLAVGRVFKSDIDIDLISISEQFLSSGKNQHQNEIEAHEFIVKTFTLKKPNQAKEVRKEAEIKGKITINGKQYDLKFVMDKFGIEKQGNEFVISGEKFKTIKEALIYSKSKNK